MLLQVDQMIIVAHRGNVIGPRREWENSIEAVNYCLSSHWSVEIDIRWNKNCGFYISHDWISLPKCQIEDYFQLIARQAEYPIALNIKELGYEDKLINELISAHVVDKVFLFDMELIEKWPGVTAHLYRRLPARHLIASILQGRCGLSFHLQQIQRF